MPNHDIFYLALSYAALLINYVPIDAVTFQVSGSSCSSRFHPDGFLSLVGMLANLETLVATKRIDTIPVQINTLSGAGCGIGLPKLEVEAGQAKVFIEMQTAIPRCRQQLMYKDVQLRDDMTFREVMALAESQATATAATCAETCVETAETAVTAAAAASGVEIGTIFMDTVTAAETAETAGTAETAAWRAEAAAAAASGIGIGTTGTDTVTTATVAAEAQEATVAAAADWSWIPRIAMVRVQAECKSGCRCCLSNPICDYSKLIGFIP